MHSRREGTVKWFDEGRGDWGYQRGRSKPGIPGSALRSGEFGIVEGMRVLFDPVTERLGYWAFNVAREHH